MPPPDIAYARGGVDVQTGTPAKVKVPPRVFRGRLTGLLFDTDKTFLLPSAMHGIRGLRRFFDRHPKLQVLVVGHTDRQGGPQHNLRLSEERARSIAAYLKDDVDFWMQYYPGRPESLPWGTREDQNMLSALSDADGPFYTGGIDGNAGPLTEGAFRRFQKSKGLGETGKADRQTRRALVDAYMHMPDTSLPQDATVLTHGCGEFHNEVPTADGVAEQRNRRVEVFFFDGKVDPEPQNPCPSPGCTQQPEWVRRTVATFDLEHEPGDLTVKVVDREGKGLPGAQVHISGPTSDDGDPSDAGGIVRFTDLVPGGYTIFAHRDGFRDGTATAPVAPAARPAGPGELAGGGEGPPTPVTLLANAGDVTITVRSGSETGPVVTDAAVSVQPRGGGAPLEGKTDGSGKANFPAVPPGKALVSVQAKGFEAFQEEIVVPAAVGSGKTVVLKAAAATLIVKVVDAGVQPPALPAPLGGATVRVLAAGASAEQTKKTKDKSDKAHAGEAAFENLPAGQANIRVQADGFALAQAQTTLAAGATATVEVRLQASTGTVVVHVTDDLGAKVDDKDVLVTLQPPGSAKALTAPTKSGDARLENVPVGKCQIIVSKPGFEDGKGTADVKSQQTVDTPVQLQRPLGELTISVVTANDVVQGALVVLERGTERHEARTEKSGDAPPFKDLPVGKYKATASLENFSPPASVEFELKSGKGQKQTIKLTPNAATAQITPGPLVVVLKKPGCSPKRQEVVLRVTGSFTGTTATGKLTRSKETVRFFTAAGKEITNTANNVFSANDLTAPSGVKILAEGGTTSSALEDTELHLDLFVGGNAFGTPATVKATVVELTLELFQSRTKAAGDPAPMSAADKINVGRFVHEQDPGFHHGRAMLVVREVKPSGFTQNLILQPLPAAAGAGVARLFAAETRPAAGDAPLPPPITITPAQVTAKDVAGSKGLAFFIEGQTASGARKDTGFQLGIAAEADGDRAVVTVVRFSNLQATIPSTQAATTRTVAGFTAAANSPVPASVVSKGTAAALVAADFDEDYAVNPPVVLIENSIAAGAPIALKVQVKPGDVPVSWSRLRDTRTAGGDVQRVRSVSPRPLPTLGAVAAKPLEQTLLADAVGSFRIRAFVDCNGSGDFDRDPAAAHSFSAEPYILLNVVLVRAQCFKNKSVVQPGNMSARRLGTPHVNGGGAPPAGNTGVSINAGQFTSAALAGVHNQAQVDVIGGGDGTRGLDRVFAGWVNNIAPTPGSPSAPNGLDINADYLQTLPAPVGGGPAPPPVPHHRFLIFTPVGARAVGGGALPISDIGPAQPNPAILPLPLLDVSPFTNEGMGGNTCVGTETAAAPGPPVVPPAAAQIAKTAIPATAAVPAPAGQRWTIHMFDSPGFSGVPQHPFGSAPGQPFFPTALVQFRFNLNFRCDLLFWTNIQGPPFTPSPTPGPVNGPAAAAPHAACCLYASVQTNLWNIRYQVNFAATAPFAPTVAVAPTMNITVDPAPSRTAQPATVEARFPPALKVAAFNSRT